MAVLLVEPWYLGASLPIGMPDNCGGNATPVLSYMGGDGRAAGHNPSSLCHFPVM